MLNRTRLAHDSRYDDVEGSQGRREALFIDSMVRIVI